MTAIDDKIKAFTPLECVEKAIEEAVEYKVALEELLFAVHTGDEHAGQKALEVFREAADVHVTGPMTLGKIWPEEYAEYQRKIDEAIGKSIPDAIQAKIRRNVAESKNPGEGMTDDEYDKMAGNAGGLF